MKLTKRSIDSFEYRGGWDIRWDDTVTGVGVRVYPSGKKSFVLSYRNKGRKRLMVLGRYGTDLTLDQARDRARKELVKLKDGGDPLDERRRKAGEKTFGELLDAYIDRHAKVHKKTWRSDQGRLNRHVPKAWRSRKASDIRQEEIADLHQKVGQTAPYEANRLIENLRKAFNLAPVWGFVDRGAFNPATGIPRFRERKRQRWVKPDELPRLAEAIDAEPSIYIRAALWLYLLAGVRRTELLQAKWEDIDWPRAMLRLPETKSGDEQFAALSAPALAILQALPRLPDNPYIIPGARLGRPLVNIDKPWRRVREAAGASDLWIHDLRRTLGSWLSQSGVDLNTIKAALRHANISTTLVYARLGADPAREAIEAHGRMLKAAGKNGPKAVGGNDGQV